MKTIEGQALLHDDKTDGGAPVKVQLWMDADRMHIMCGDKTYLHISVYDEDVLSCLEGDLLGDDCK